MIWGLYDACVVRLCKIHEKSVMRRRHWSVIFPSQREIFVSVIQQSENDCMTVVKAASKIINNFKRKKKGEKCLHHFSKFLSTLSKCGTDLERHKYKTNITFIGFYSTGFHFQPLYNEMWEKGCEMYQN